jgi:hypothetical protein
MDDLLTNHFTTITLIPQYIQNEYFSAIHKILKMVIDAESYQDQATAYRWYIGFPQLLLRQPKHSSIAKISRQLRLFNQGFYSTLLKNWQRDLHALSNKNRKTQTSPDFFDKKMISLINQGYIRKGIRIGQSFGVAKMTPNVRNQLLDLHPQHATDIPQLPQWNDVAIDMSALDNVVKDTWKDPDIGVGPRGFHPHYIECLRSSTSEVASQAYEMFRTLGSSFLSGKMHPSIRALLLAGMVTPLNKTDDADQPKIRPIKCEDADCNLWSKAASRAYTPSILAEVAPQQVGIGVSSANETMVHGERMCYELADRDQQPLATYYADISKAHNDFERANTLTEIYRLAGQHAHLRPIAVILYSILSVQPHIYIRGKNGVPEHLCYSKRGGGQGNALTGIAFCLNINPVLKQMSLEYPDVSTLAYHDDIKLQGPPQTIFSGDSPAFQRLSDLLTENGNQVNIDKGMAYVSCDNDRGRVPDFIKQPSITIGDTNHFGYVTNRNSYGLS